jgi:hypothetical protein
MSAVILCLYHPMSVAALRLADTLSKESCRLSDEIQNVRINSESKQVREHEPSRKKKKICISLRNFGQQFCFPLWGVVSCFVCN